MDNYKVAKELAEVLSQRKASDVVLIDIAEKSSFAPQARNVSWVRCRIVSTRKRTNWGWSRRAWRGSPETAGFSWTTVTLL